MLLFWRTGKGKWIGHMSFSHHSMGEYITRDLGSHAEYMQGQGH